MKAGGQQMIKWPTPRFLGEVVLKVTELYLWR